MWLLENKLEKVFNLITCKKVLSDANDYVNTLFYAYFPTSFR